MFLFLLFLIHNLYWSWCHFFYCSSLLFILYFLFNKFLLLFITRVILFWIYCLLIFSYRWRLSLHIRTYLLIRALFNNTIRFLFIWFIFLLNTLKWIYRLCIVTATKQFLSWCLLLLWTLSWCSSLLYTLLHTTL